MVLLYQFCYLNVIVVFIFFLFVAIIILVISYPLGQCCQCLLSLEANPIRLNAHLLKLQVLPIAQQQVLVQVQTHIVLQPILQQQIAVHVQVDTGQVPWLFLVLENLEIDKIPVVPSALEG
jgi:hypothetical protein